MRGGKLKDLGMASFANNITAKQSEAVRAYVIQQAQRAQALQNAAASEAVTKPMTISAPTQATK